MGGMGSGGHNRTGRSTTAEARALDVNSLRRAGALEPGRCGGWQWTHDGQRVADIRLEATLGAVTLVYRWRRADGPWQEVRERVAVTWVPCRFGGERPFLHCPRCGRRGVKLYAVGARFLCRACNQLVYPSQREHAPDRARRRATRIRMTLGGLSATLTPFPSKPKGMHWRTYERRRAELQAAERSVNEWLMQRCRKLEDRLQQLENPRGGDAEAPG